MDEPYMIWPDAPYRGVLIPADKFKTSVGLMSAAHEIEKKGLNALPERPLKSASDDLLWGGAVGAAVVLTLCFLLKCQF